MTALAGVLQMVHGTGKPPVGAVDPNPKPSADIIPAARALAISCEEVLTSRKTSVALSYTKKMAHDFVNTLSSYCIKNRFTLLEQGVGYIGYLSYLRQTKIGMDRDELGASVVVYNLEVAYTDLLAVDGIRGVRKGVIIGLHNVLLHGLHP